MDHHLKDFYRQSPDEAPCGNFHAVISLHDEPEFTWKKALEKVPNLCKGWFELSHLSSKDRIEFLRDFWLSKLPYREGLDQFLNRFFASLDDIGIFITQKKFEDPYEAHLVYSIKSNGGFFSGGLPADEKKILELQKNFPNQILPHDYLAFLQIHNGFSKATDSTGVIASEAIPKTYWHLQKYMQERGPIINSLDAIVDPKTLIPFYESFGMPFYQCFLSEWYPEQEMGNVYYSGSTHTISDIYSGTTSSETMAFSTFTDWLIFYLERVE